MLEARVVEEVGYGGIQKGGQTTCDALFSTRMQVSSLQ